MNDRERKNQLTAISLLEDAAMLLRGDHPVRKGLRSFIGLLDAEMQPVEHVFRPSDHGPYCAEYVRGKLCGRDADDHLSFSLRASLGLRVVR